MKNWFAGRLDVGVLVPMVVGMMYAGTGGWTAERWNGALAMMGLGAAKGAYEKGYWTENPALRTHPDLELNPLPPPPVAAEVRPLSESLVHRSPVPMEEVVDGRSEWLGE